MKEKKKIPSMERGCQNKINLGRKFKQQADKLSEKNNKQYGVYECPHCNGFHLTTKIKKENEYTKRLVYVTVPRDSIS